MPFTQEIIDHFKHSHEELNKFHYALANDIPSNILTNIMMNACDNEIDSKYIEETKDALLKNNHEFSMVAMFKIEKYDMENMLGFIVLQHGECEMLPNTYSVNLICSNKNKGKILMGLALYAIKTNPHVQDKACVLELAGGYINASGFCMYSKFGFVADKMLYNSQCFKDANNLPMKANLDNISPADIVKRSITSVETSETICKDRSKQMYLGMAMNLKTRLDLIRLGLGVDDVINVSLSPPHRYLNKSYNYQRLFNNCKQNVDGLIKTIERAVNDDEFISFFKNTIITYKQTSAKITSPVDMKNRYPSRRINKATTIPKNNTNKKRNRATTSRSRSISRSISMTMSRNRNNRNKNQKKHKL